MDAVGAGLATVLGNLQVIVVAFVAWLLSGERPRRDVLVALPIVLFGVVLISGVIGSDPYGANPQLGVILGLVTACLLLGLPAGHPLGGRDRRRPAGPVAVATSGRVLARWLSARSSATST